MLRSPYAGIVLAVFAVVACLAVECLTVSMFLKAMAISSWPTTTGEILSSELTSQFKGTSTSYEAKVEYEYQVDGKSYRSNQVRTRGTATKHRYDVAAVVAKFPPGAQVPVHYNAANPSEAYLVTGVDFVNYIIIVSPLFFAGLAVYFIIGRWKELKAEGANPA